MSEKNDDITDDFDDENEFDFNPNEDFSNVQATESPHSQLTPKQMGILAASAAFVIYVGYSLLTGGKEEPELKIEQQKVQEEKHFEVARPDIQESLTEEENKQEELTFDDLAAYFPTEQKDDRPKDSSKKMSIEKIQNTIMDTGHDNKVFNESITALSDRLDNNVTQLDNLEATINGVADTISNVTNNLEKMDEHLNQLTKKVTSVTAELKKLKQEIGDEGLDAIESNSHPTREEKQTLIYNGPEYVVHAILPGRAWLKSSKGQIVTISEGDVLGDYGKILVIDSNDGIVVTSSGISFR